MTHADNSFSERSVLRILLCLFSLISLFVVVPVNAQIENVSIDDPVYIFIKEMQVRGAIKNFDNGLSGLSRFQVVNYLNEAKNSGIKLSVTEKSLIERYLVDFDPERINKKTSFSLFGGTYDMSKSAGDIFSDKQKYLYAYKNGPNNIFVRGGGHLGYANRFKPDSKADAEIYDIGFDIRGTLFEHLGYYFYVLKGGVSGDTTLAELMLPELRSNFKYLENIENIRSYDFAKGYLKYYFDSPFFQQLFES